MTPAQLIAANLAALPHPDGGVRGLPGFQARLLPEPMQAEIGRTAQDIGDGIVHLLTTNGYRITAGEELTAAPDPADVRVVALTCRLCGTVLLELSVADSRVLTDGPTLLRALGDRAVECPHGR